MALQTDLNVFPYYDDYDPNKNFYRVLFRPGVAVQARELNQLQSILQNQIERFGDNIFKRGTIIEGCNITRHDVLPYVKIKDTETDGAPVAINTFEGLSVRNSSNVNAYIVKTAPGFESRSPDLNTLFVKYNSSGNDSNTATFSASDVLTIYSSDYPIFKTRVNNGSSLFSNNDGVVFVSALAVTNSTGGNTFPASSFVAGQTIQNGVANLVIIEANATANAEVLILKVKPLSDDLLTANTTKWRFGVGESIRNASTANTANVVSVIGSGATGSLVTDSLGKVLSISITGQGSGYYIAPHVTVMKQSTSALANTDINDLSVTALNYLADVTVANSALTPIGTGYGVTVDAGTIYQKGFFSRVESQLVVVNKYSNTDFTKSVGFYTAEDFIDSNEDPTLLDNATGTYNYAAPGADRLLLTPELRVLDKAEADANTEFLPIIEFADGRPYRQNQTTVYNVIGDEIAKRTYEESGNYVQDQFIVTTRDSSTFSDTSLVFKINIDPGKAFINGYRVESGNYSANIAKGVATATNNNARIRLGYGNYLQVKQLAGNFPFNISAQVDLYDTAATYITTNAGNAIASVGNKIGEARIRSLTLLQGTPGFADTTYKLYLFDVVMSSGKNFADVRSVYYSGTNKGIADVDTSVPIQLQGSNESGLLYNSVPAMKSVSNISYTYRTVNESESANTTGYIELNLGSDTYFPYTGVLTSSSLNDLLVIPKTNYQASAAAVGAITLGGGGNTANVFVAISGNFNNFAAGDFVKFANSTGGTTVVSQIKQVSNSTTLELTSGPGQSYSGGSITLYYPANVPISLNRAGRYANVSVSNSQVMTIYLANNIANSTGGSSSANLVVAYNAVRNNVSSAVKTANRSVFTRIVCSNNAGSNTGPWALGLSDAFRLRKVYIANGASRAVTFNANTGVLNSGTANAFLQVTNNPFANGDSVVYNDLTGVVTGLANTTTYYAVYANSTGMALASTRGGANLTLTATATSENHTLTGQPIFFTGNTYGVLDVTNDFYIDTNQTLDYLDTSYLYRQARATSLTTNDVLLVQYDVFTGGDAGIKTISSYTIDDTLNFDALSAQSNVHTMELPEVKGYGDKYYDIRDQYDFRPRSANTINLITDISSVAAGANAASIINPTEPTAANRFSASEKYFPAPDTDLTATIQYYLGRTDRIVVDNSGNFLVRSGKNGFLNEIAPEPKNSMTLEILTIPPYPSLPVAKSADMIKIIDTRITNEGYGRRVKNYTVTSNIGIADRARIQTKGYKMSDIASLEHRIQTLEYYVSFTLAEALAKARYIPSSLDSLTDRFRFGFFVDPFTDYNYADLGNPEFYATINDNLLWPRMTEINLEFKPDNGSTGIVTLPFNEFTIVAQNDATNGPVVVAPTPVANTTGPVTVTTVTQKTEIVQQAQRSTSRSDSGTVYEDFFYTFSTLVGPVEFYINGRDNNMAVEVSQSTTSGGTFTPTITSANCQSITSSDITAKSLFLNGRVIEHPGELRRKSYGPVGGFVEDQFKLLWTHNPNNGIYYRIRVYKGNNHGGQGASGTYEYKMFYPSDVVTTSTQIVSNPATFAYNGTAHTVTPSSFTITLSQQYLFVLGASIPNGAFISDAQRFTISVTGLKPNTYHKFMFDGTDRTAKCSQNRTSTTNTTGLLSDANGSLNFDFYYDAGINEATSDLEQQNKLASAVAGTKVFTVQSYDGNSRATGSIGLKYYTNITNFGAVSVLNSTITSTMAATGATTTSNTAAATAQNTLIQSVNDAIDLSNVQINRDILNNLWFL